MSSVILVIISSMILAMIPSNIMPRNTIMAIITSHYIIYNTSENIINDATISYITGSATPPKIRPAVPSIAAFPLQLKLHKI